MRCEQCGKSLDNESRCFKSNVQGEEKYYCCAECCINDLINKGYVEMFDDSSLLFNDKEYSDSFDLMFDIGDYIQFGSRKNRRVFESEPAAIKFAGEVGGTWKMEQIPDYMRVDTVFVVEW